MNNANYVPYSYLSAYYDKMSVLIYDAILLCTPKNFCEVSIFICRSDFLSSTWSFLLASTVIVQVQRYGSGLWK